MVLSFHSKVIVRSHFDPFLPAFCSRPNFACRSVSRSCNSAANHTGCVLVKMFWFQDPLERMPRSARRLDSPYGSLPCAPVPWPSVPESEMPKVQTAGKYLIGLLNVRNFFEGAQHVHTQKRTHKHKHRHTDTYTHTYTPQHGHGEAAQLDLNSYAYTHLHTCVYAFVCV